MGTSSSGTIVMSFWPESGGAGKGGGFVPWFLGILVALAVAWTLRATTLVTMPVAAAFFLAIGVWPVCRWVRERAPPRLRWLGYAAAMLVIVALLSIFVAALWFAAERVSAELPKYGHQLQQFWERLAPWLDKAAPATPDASNGPPRDSGDAASSDPVARFLPSVASLAWHTASTIILILFLTLLMLIEAPIWGGKIANTLTGEARLAWLETVTAVAQRFRRFVVVSTMLGLATGVLYGVWLSVFGLDLVLLFALLAFVLNYVPMVGSLVSGILPVLFALFQQGAQTAAMVGLGLLVIEQVMGNYVAPRLEGRHVTISPLVVLVALLVWTWIWGIAGALLAIPMTVLIAITLGRIDALKPLALFLSDEHEPDCLQERIKPD